MKLTKKQTIAIAAIVLCGAALAALIIMPRAQNGAMHEAAHSEQDEKDEHGGAHGKEDAHGKAGQPEHADEPLQATFSAEQIKTAGITLAVAGPAPIVPAIALSGEIRYDGDRTAHVVPRLAGMVESVNAELGQQVKKGQVLAVLSSRELSELRSELLSARQRQSLAQTLLARERKLWEERISAEQDYLQAQQQANEAGIAVRNAQQKLDALGAASGSAPHSGAGPLNRYEVRAPFDGTVLEKHIAAGEAVKEDANIFTLSDLSSVWAEFAVTAPHLDAVRVGQQASVTSVSSGASAIGTVAYVGALLGEQTRAATARIRLKNPGTAWRPGLFVNVRVFPPAADAANAVTAAVAVQSSAVQTLEGKPAIFVRTPAGFAAQTVALGRGDGKLVEVLSGLKPGAQYAADGSFAIKAELGKSDNEHAH
ncbi:cytochrome C peroxidase [Massilia sp. Root418]|uniref:efflux RND transporter periplasmic adaptor subunit n=1 Tax=Massilia sp. Root418 TaxID=1736532 RepID=UPI0006F7F8E7|nr:efflux RND transporter periplasmic adaptor subunit [Massilia sp. Root418]KQW97234.1 cytochrome C peroxidase [Massilia sp. Root418]